jgi:hypothetical protein
LCSRFAVQLEAVIGNRPRGFDIPKHGNNAHKQIASDEHACEAGKASLEALQAVVDMLIEETSKDLQ